MPDGHVPVLSPLFRRCSSWCEVWQHPNKAHFSTSWACGSGWEVTSRFWACALQNVNVKIKAPHPRVRVAARRDVHSAKKAFTCSVFCFLCFWLVCWGFLVHVPQLSRLPLLRNTCTNNEFCFVGELGTEAEAQLEPQVFVFVDILLWHIEYMSMHRWTRPFKPITCGLHYDVAKESNNCAIIQLLFSSRLFNLYIAEHFPSLALGFVLVLYFFSF